MTVFFTRFFLAGSAGSACSAEGGLQSPDAATPAPAILRALLLLGCAGAVALAATLAAALGGPQAALTADPELAFLLRGMAVIKACMALAAAAVLWWRFGHAIGRGHAAVYLAGMGLVAGATVLIWALTAIAAAALVFHVGAFTLLFAAWADRRSGVVTLPRFLARP